MKNRQGMCRKFPAGKSIIMNLRGEGGGGRGSSRRKPTHTLTHAVERRLSIYTTQFSSVERPNLPAQDKQLPAIWGSPVSVQLPTEPPLVYVIISGDKQSLPRTHYKDLLKEHLKKREGEAACVV